MSDDYPIVQLPGSDNWESGYLWGGELEKAFPLQDGTDFSYACAYNDYGPAATLRITNLEMLEQGFHDGDDWVWRVTFEDGAIWIAQGGCDYTGWDCQSYLVWTAEP